jgi:hypothetical protein
MDTMELTIKAWLGDMGPDFLDVAAIILLPSL